MAQYKKEEIQTSIIDAAAICFAKRGYQNTSIADIAKEAGISVGNIYRYYKGKDVLLDDVLPESFVEEFSNQLRDKILTGKTTTIYEQVQDHEFAAISEEFQRAVLKNRYRLAILLRHPQGTPYESFREELENHLVEFVLEQFLVDEKERGDKRDLLKIIYDGYIQMSLSIAATDWDDDRKLRELGNLNQYHIMGLSTVLDKKNN